MGAKTAKEGRTGVGGGEQEPEGGEGTGGTDENDRGAGKPGVMLEARRKRRRQGSEWWGAGAWGAPAAVSAAGVGVAAGAARASGSPRLPRTAGGGARGQAGPGAGGPGRGAARRRRRVSPAEGSQSFTRRRLRRGASGRPITLAAVCGQRDGGDSGAGPVTGAGPGRRADAPRPRLLLGAYRALVPHAAAATSSPVRTTDYTPSPPPPHRSGPGAAAAPGLRPPSRRLPRAGRGPARASGVREAGRMHGRRPGRRKEAAAGPGRAPAAAWPAPGPRRR